MAKITSTQGLGWGVTRLHASGIGYVDVAAESRPNPQGWMVSVVKTNVIDSVELDAIVKEFRVMEGIDPEI